LAVLAAAILALGITATPASAQRDSRAEAFVTGWVDAAGGPKIWDNVRDLRYTITTVWYDSTGTEVRRRPRLVWVKKTSRAFLVRVERTEAEGRYVQIWNGRGAASLNGTQLPDTSRAVKEVQFVAGDLTYWIGLPWKLRDPGVHLRFIPENDVPVVHVTFGEGVGLHDGDQFWYYWHDRNSRFPSEVHYLLEGRATSERQRVAFGDLQRLGPGLYFSRRTTQNAHGVPVRALIVSDVVVNRGVSDSLFRLD
jgi:hypothetical protein